MKGNKFPARLRILNVSDENIDCSKSETIAMVMQKVYFAKFTAIA